jgi:hypothetical protein
MAEPTRSLPRPVRTRIARSSRARRGDNGHRDHLEPRRAAAVGRRHPTCLAIGCAMVPDGRAAVGLDCRADDVPARGRAPVAVRRSSGAGARVRPQHRGRPGRFAAGDRRRPDDASRRPRLSAGDDGRCQGHLSAERSGLLIGVCGWGSKTSTSSGGRPVTRWEAGREVGITKRAVDIIDCRRALASPRSPCGGGHGEGAGDVHSRTRFGRHPFCD